jgi:AraC-like DNA-binding protein
MTVTYEERSSSSPFVESIWHTQAVSDGVDIVSADVSWDMIIVRQDGKARLCVWGPMTKAVPIAHAEGTEHLGIRFKLGTFMSGLPAYNLLDSGTVLPEARRQAFYLNGSIWECPNYENVEAFINRLVRGDLLGRDTVVEAALRGHLQYMSLRNLQRRFLHVTGLTQRDIRSIERAQQAASLLVSGTSVLDAVYQAGYADQQSMTKSFKRLLGQTPAQIARLRTQEKLSSQDKTST